MILTPWLTACLTYWNQKVKVMSLNILVKQNHVSPTRSFQNFCPQHKEATVDIWPQPQGLSVCFKRSGGSLEGCPLARQATLHEVFMQVSPFFLQVIDAQNKCRMQKVVKSCAEACSVTYHWLFQILLTVGSEHTVFKKTLPYFLPNIHMYERVQLLCL